MLRRLLVVAGTPVALAILFCEPRVSAARDDVAAEAPEAAEEHHGGPLVNLARFDYRSRNAEGGKWVPGEHKMPPPFSMALLNFAAFAYLIGRVAAPSLKRVVRERADEIGRALAESRRLRDEARARLAEYDRKLATLQQEIDALASGIRAEAEATKRRIIADAEARAERMGRDAEQQIQAEMQRVRTILEREAVETAIGIAERLFTDKASGADQHALADRFVMGMKDATRKRPRA